MPQSRGRRDGVVPGGTICRTDDHTTVLDAKAQKALNNLTSPKVENRRFISPTCSCGCPHCCR